MKYEFLFRNLEIDQETQKKLDNRITDTIDSVVINMLSPFEYYISYGAWGLCDSQRINYPNFPQGMYDSEQQAYIALGLYQARRGNVQGESKWEYQELYRLSKFIWQGLQ